MWKASTKKWRNAERERVKGRGRERGEKCELPMTEQYTDRAMATSPGPGELRLANTARLDAERGRNLRRLFPWRYDSPGLCKQGMPKLETIMQQLAPLHLAGKSPRKMALCLILALCRMAAKLWL